MRKTVGIIGFGNMGSAIAERIKSKFEVWVFDKDKSRTKNLVDISVANVNIDLVNRADTVILAVKPQDFDAVLNEIKNYVAGKLIISIAAGISTKDIEAILRKARVVRVMPNIGVKIGEAETSLCKGRFANEDDFNSVQELFSLLGKTWRVKEEDINPSTAISGSAPAYFYYDFEKNKIDPYNISEEKKQDYIARLTKAGESIGLTAEYAKDLAVNVTYTSINLITKTGMSPSKLIKQISSPGGTTEAALEILRRGGSWEDAAKAAVERAKKLAKRS